MRYLLDTCAIFELSKPSPEKDVVEYLLSLPIQDTFLSSITIGEIRRGIARLPHGKKRSHLEGFLERQILTFDRNVRDFEPTGAMIINPWPN